MLSSQVYNASESCSELLLTYGTLGRFDHIEANVIQTLVNFLTKYTTSSDYDKVVLLIHALGNTGSDKIVPIVVPFIFNPNIDVQFAAIDALRAVSRNEVVLEAFASYIHEAELEEQVVAVVRSLLFPFKRSLYFQQLPYGADTSEIEQFLMNILVESCIRIKSANLNKAAVTYLRYIGTEKSLSLMEKLQHGLRSRRESTDDWSDGKNIYNAIADRSSRIQDEQDFGYHKAFMWAEQLGTNDLHVTVAAGGFGGIELVATRCLPGEH